MATELRILASHEARKRQADRVFAASLAASLAVNAVLLICAPRFEALRTDTSPAPARHFQIFVYRPPAAVPRPPVPLPIVPVQKPVERPLAAPKAVPRPAEFVATPVVAARTIAKEQPIPSRRAYATPLPSTQAAFVTLRPLNQTTSVPQPIARAVAPTATPRSESSVGIAAPPMRASSPANTAVQSAFTQAASIAPHAAVTAPVRPETSAVSTAPVEPKPQPGAARPSPATSVAQAPRQQGIPSDRETPEIIGSFDDISLPGFDPTTVNASSVVVTWEVDEQGRVHSVHFKSTGNPDVDAAMRSAVENFRFKPRTVDGVPQPATLTHTFDLGS